MYIKYDGNYADTDLSFLEDILCMLDSKLFELNKKIEVAIANSIDPDALGLFDKGEYIVGMGFVACQRYLSSTFGPVEIDKVVALNIGPNHVNGKPIVKVINAAANYWKHSDEWSTIDFTAEEESEMFSINVRNPELIPKSGKGTHKIIQTVTQWTDYTCVNILLSLTSTGDLKLIELVPVLKEWRNQLDSVVSNDGNN